MASMAANPTPMHTALSMLGTMAGQYIAAQAQAAKQQPQQQPSTIPNLFAPTQPTVNANAANLCDECHARPKYFDGTKTHPYCGKGCAAAAKNNGTSANTNANAGVKRGRSHTVGGAAAGQCDYCHQRPKHFDGQKTLPHCSRSCAQKAKAAGTSPAGTPPKGTGNSKNGCLICGKPSNQGHFCSKKCSTTAEQRAPVLLEVPVGHATFQSVKDQFETSWRHQTSKPTVRRIYKVVSDTASLKKYEAYRSAVEARGNFVAAGKSAGNENRRWHGTTRECLLGDNGNANLCSSTTCSLCCILRTSYRINLSGKKTGWGRFGSGIYTSATSSKSNDYSTNVKPSRYKAIMLNKVVVGKGCKMTQDNTTLTAPPPGYDSVLAEVAQIGRAHV